MKTFMKKSITPLLLLSLVAVCLFTSCEKEDIIDDKQENKDPNNNGNNNDDTKPLTVGCVTGNAENIVWKGATLHFTITPNLDAQTIEGGVCVWKQSEGDNPDMSNISHFTDGEYKFTKNKENKFSMTFEYLENNTPYYYCAWANFDDVKYYGEVKAFTTAELNLAADKAVDLGLSVKWAGYNVGASAPEESGSFFAWGETSPKESYTWSNYGSDENPLNTIYSKDAKTRLEPADDAATVNWGEGYRMPTCDEKHELLSNTTQYYVTYKNVPGVVFESQKNGNLIFFPYTGEMSYTTLQGADELVGIWTSDLYIGNNTDEAYIMCNIIAGGGILRKAGFDMDRIASSYNLHSYRYKGYTVRPVKP